MDNLVNTQLKKKNVYTKVHALFALWTLVLSGFYYHYLLDGVFWGGNEFLIVVFAAAFCLSGILFFYARGKSIKWETIFFAALTVVYSIRFVIYGADDIISLLDVFVIHLTALLFVASMEESVLDKIIPSGIRAVIIAPFSSFIALPVSFSAFFSKSSGKKDGNMQNLLFVIVGICISVPLLSVVLLLLSSDGFFSGFTDKIADSLLSILANMRIFDYFNIFTILIALYIYGAFYSADKGVGKNIKKITPGFPRAMTYTVMVMLLAVYALFALSQIDGYTGMILGKIPSGTTYAEFARSGFYELCIVACINGAVLYIAKVFTEKEGSRLTKIFSDILTYLTLFLILTSGVKMVMYITAYGFTPKRFYTMWFMILLAIIFALTLVKSRREEYNLSKVSVFVTAAMLLVLFFVDFEVISVVLNRIFGFTG